ncbi:MAG: type II toxin-antitoxin system RelE/ParE family toxin [Bauldia sp.]|jgi:plasmid stabilization system protein ParE
MKVRLSEDALADLEGIRAWVATDNPEAADRILLRVFETIRLLASFPRMGRAGRNQGMRERPVTGLPYVIVYQVDEGADLVSIEAVFHGARDGSPGITG